MNIGNMPARPPALARQNAVMPNFFAPMPLQRMNALNPARQNAFNPARNLVPVVPFAAVVPENPKPIMNTVNTVTKNNMRNNNTKKRGNKGRRRRLTRK